MLLNLPLQPALFLLGIAGAVIGALINWAIYQWAFFHPRSISPWQRPATNSPPRRGRDYLPVFGWPARRREEAIHGRRFWLRPMVVEIIWLVGLPWFGWWLHAGGLTDGLTPTDSMTWGWLTLYSVWIGLMFVATFIDFDEQIIPDEVTIPGTLFAVALAALVPASRLPVAIAGGLGGPRIESLTYLSPQDPAMGAPGREQLGFALLIFAVWIWALLPKLSPWYAGWGTSIRFMYAHAFRPRRKTTCGVRVRDRAMPGITRILMGLLVVGAVAIAATFQFGNPTQWHSLFGSLLGLAFGGMLIWSIRVIGTFAMQQEAMGFGDVTLMAMIGATLGWQATLLAFVYAIAVVVVCLPLQILITGNRALPFGPYLCGGALVLLFCWPATWQSAAVGVFALGPLLLAILAGSLLLMAILLIGIQWVKRIAGIGGSG